MTGRKPSSADEARTRRNWEAWATRAIGGGPERIRRATDAAMGVVLSGGSADAAMQAARKTAASGSVRPMSAHADAGPGRGLRGRVVGLRQSFEPRYRQASLLVTTFRLARTDAAGGALAPVPVELKGRLDSSINEGDLVEIPGTWRPGTTLRTTRLRNVTTGVTVKSHDINRNPFVRLFRLAMFAGVLAFFVFVISNIVGGWSRFPAFGQSTFGSFAAPFENVQDAGQPVSARSAGGSNVRQGPSMDEEVFATLVDGEEAVVECVTPNGWMRLLGPYNGGWVHRNVLTVDAEPPPC